LFCLFAFGVCCFALASANLGCVVNSESSDFLGSESDTAKNQFALEPREKATDSTAQSTEQRPEPAEPSESRKKEKKKAVDDVIQLTSSGGPPSDYANHVSFLEYFPLQ
jgi:hypothetical protein